MVSVLGFFLQNHHHRIAGLSFTGHILPKPVTIVKENFNIWLPNVLNSLKPQIENRKSSIVINSKLKTIVPARRPLSFVLCLGS